MCLELKEITQLKPDGLNLDSHLVAHVENPNGIIPLTVRLNSLSPRSPLTF